MLYTATNCRGLPARAWNKTLLKIAGRLRKLRPLLYAAIALAAIHPAYAQTQGDPNKFSSTSGNPSCKFFDGFADNGDGTVTDPRNGLIWKQCAEGTARDGLQCQGKPSRMNWYDAMKYAKTHRFLNKSDWRLPSKEELVSVVGNYKDGCENNYISKGQLAYSDLLGIHSEADAYYASYWAYSPISGHDSYAWVVGLSDGGVSDLYRSYYDAVRLVRASQLSGGKAALAAFNTEYKKMEQHIKAETRILQ